MPTGIVDALVQRFDQLAQLADRHHRYLRCIGGDRRAATEREGHGLGQGTTVTNVAQVERFTKMCGAGIPRRLSRRLKIVESDPSAVVATGVLWTADQCKELLSREVPGIHFYTLNKSSATLAVHASLGL